MAKYATIADGEVYKIRNLTDEQIAAIPDHKKSVILPVVEEARPAFDSTTHHAPNQSKTIEATRYLIAWSKPVAKTQQEMDDEAEAKKEGTLDSYDELSDSISLRNENRLLALEGKPPVTEAEFRAIKKAML